MTAPASIGLHSRVSGDWERIDHFERKTIKGWGFQVYEKVHTKVAGVWEVVYVSALGEILLPNYLITGVDEYSPYNSSATYTLQTDGRALKTETGSGSSDLSGWKSFEYGRAFEVAYNIISEQGTFNTSPSMNEGQYYPLSTQREYIMSSTAIGFRSTVIDITIRLVADTSINKTGRITLVCENGSL